jgi:hypothetical protein
LTFVDHEPTTISECVLCRQETSGRSTCGKEEEGPLGRPSLVDDLAEGRKERGLRSPGSCKGRREISHRFRVVFELKRGHLDQGKIVEQSFVWSLDEIWKKG